MPYIREIDGLRTLAVFLVLFYHLNIQVFKGGFIGVDIFFTISGYLITATIHGYHNYEFNRIKNYYHARIRRLAPLYFAVLIFGLIASICVLTPAELLEIYNSALFSFLFVSNFLFWRTTGYFGYDPELVPFLHTWSLSLEMQFYVIYPILIAILVKYAKQKMMCIFMAILLCSLATSIWGVYNKPVATFFLLPTRLWEFMVGALVFLCKKNEILLNFKQRKISSEAICIIAVLTIFFSGSALLDRHSVFPGHNAILPTFSCALILLYCDNSTFTKRILGSSVASHFGKLSYGIYLWHFIVIALAKSVTESSFFEVSESFLIMLFTYVLSVISYYTIEVQFIKKYSKKTLFWFLLISACLGLILISAIKLTKGFENLYLSGLTEDELSVYDKVQKHTNKDIVKRMYDNKSCIFWTSEINEIFEERFLNCLEKFESPLLILGDSHAMNLYNIVAQSVDQEFVVGISFGGCRPAVTSNNNRCYYGDLLKFLSLNNQVNATLVYHQSGSYLVKDWRGVADSPELFQSNAVVTFDDSAFRAIDEYLSELDKYGDVYWYGPFVEARVNFFDRDNYKSDLKVLPASIELFKFIDKKLKMETYDSKQYLYNSMLNVLRFPYDYVIVEECVTFNDADHFSACGEALLAKELSNDSRWHLLFNSER